MGHERKDLGDEALLDAGVLGGLFRYSLLASGIGPRQYQLGVEFGQPGLARVIEDLLSSVWVGEIGEMMPTEHRVDHGGNCTEELIAKIWQQWHVISTYP